MIHAAKVLSAFALLTIAQVIANSDKADKMDALFLGYFAGVAAVMIWESIQ